MSDPAPNRDQVIASISPEAIRAAAAIIAPQVRRTPVLLVDGADVDVPGVKLAFKLEFTQHTGSFKARGAFYSMLSRALPKAGVVAASGGNHGAAVAYAAMKLGVAATIFVPSVASPAKIAQIRGYGADLRFGGDRYADALAASESFVADSGAQPIHAFDQPETLIGQGTIALEFEAQQNKIDALLVAVGGGGLIGGIAAWHRGSLPLVAVEPTGAPTLERALAAGAPVDAPTGSIAADSLAPRRVGALMFPLAQRYVQRAVLVDDEAIRAAQKTLWRALRLVVEPGGATAFAALQSRAYVPQPGQTIGVILCGANTTAVDFDR